MSTQTLSARYPCSQCGLSFHSIKNWKIHNTQNHQRALTQSIPSARRDRELAKGRLICGVCETALGRPDSLWDHIKTQHMKVPASLQYCPICALLVPDSGIQTHISRLHPSVDCYFCGLVFPTFRIYCMHFNAAHRKPACSLVAAVRAVCGLCERDFLTGDELMKHIFAGHLELPCQHVALMHS